MLTLLMGVMILEKILKTCSDNHFDWMDLKQAMRPVGDVCIANG